MELKNFFSIIKKRLWFIVLVAFIFSLVTLLISKFYLKPQYRASTLLIIGDENVTTSKPSVSDLTLYQDITQTYSEFVSTRKVATDIVKSLNLQIAPEALQSMITATPSKDSRFLTISVTSTDKNIVAPIANQVVTSLKNATSDLIKSNTLHVIDEAQTPTYPFAPNTSLYVSIAFFLGVLLSIGGIFLHVYIDSTIKSEDELSELLGAPVLGIIPSFAR